MGFSLSAVVSIYQKRSKEGTVEYASPTVIISFRTIGPAQRDIFINESVDHLQTSLKCFLIFPCGTNVLELQRRNGSLLFSVLGMQQRVPARLN